jgi:biotin synthase-like enzyme
MFNGKIWREEKVSAVTQALEAVTNAAQIAVCAAIGQATRQHDAALAALESAPGKE